jgi:hypothetical protein
MKFIIVFLSLFFFTYSYNLWAQNHHLQDVVYLHNGSIIRGKIIEKSPESVKIQTADQSIFVWAMTEVKNITQEKRPYFVPKPGYINAFELGILSGTNENIDFWGQRSTKQNYASFSFQTFQGHQWHHLISTGVVTGIDIYSYQTLTPLCLGVRGDFSKSRVSPFYTLEHGYSMAFLSPKSDGRENFGGWVFNMAMGLKIRTLSKTSYLISIGYRSQKSRVKQNDTWGSGFSDIKQTFNRLALRFGMSF